MISPPCRALQCPHRENFLVLDIFFEALNYEAIEQKKAYDLAGLLGDCPHLPMGPRCVELCVPAPGGCGAGRGWTTQGRSQPQTG